MENFNNQSQLPEQSKSQGVGISAKRALEVLTPLVGLEISSHLLQGKTGKVDKGLTGKSIELLIGLTNNSSRQPDGGSWELKTHAMKTYSSGLIMASQTVALTMVSEMDFYNLSTGEVLEFESSHLFKKISNTIYVGIERPLRTGETYLRSVCHFSLDKELQPDFYEQVKKDYDLIRDVKIETGIFRSALGVRLQARTKGPANSTSRAFYWRMKTMREINLTVF